MVETVSADGDDGEVHVGAQQARQPVSAVSQPYPKADSSGAGVQLLLARCRRKAALATGLGRADIGHGRRDRRFH